MRRARLRLAALQRPQQEAVMPASKSSRGTVGAKRGFAAMDPAKQREIASKGGKASHGGGRRPVGAAR
jgi:general stress protein YciG